MLTVAMSRYIKRCLSMLILVCLSGALTMSVNAKPIVIAHRGASGYLPEHTLEAKALAYAMKPDYIEQDIVMTKDDHLIILHDRYLDRVSDVAQKFPQRARKDGRYYAIDFTLAEVKTLRVTEGFKMNAQGKKIKVLPHRFPLWTSAFQISTFIEEIELIQGLNQTLQYNVGLYSEIKAPWFHRHEGKDISLAVLQMLKKYGYTQKSDKIYVQCFDPNELQRIHTQLMPRMGINLKLIQLIADTRWQETMEIKNHQLINYSYAWMFEPDGMKRVSQYAVGIGPWISMLVSPKSTMNQIQIHPLLQSAREAGLQIHPYTFRADPSRLPKYARDFEDVLSIFYHQVKVDGFFTDFPDKVVHFIEKQSRNTYKYIRK